jgi:type II secretory pathway pseudopilin PulG
VKLKLRSSVAGNRRVGAFTLIELLVVMGIILLLAGLILATSGYVQKKGARSRTEAEIAVLSAAIESYKADNGVYPRGQSTTKPPWDPNLGPSQYPVATTGTDDLNARVNGDPSPTNGSTIYQYASRYLYEQLSGDVNLTLFQIPLVPPKKSYFDFKPSMLWLIPDKEDNSIGLSYILDPFGNSYGYSTAYQIDPITGIWNGKGHNPTFDLWSTGGLTTNPPTIGTDTITPQWIKNW